MGLRRDAREAAAQYLYQREMQGDESDNALSEFYDMRGLSPSGRRFCDALLQGWMRHRESVDEAIRKNALSIAMSCALPPTRSSTAQMFRQPWPLTRPLKSPKNSAREIQENSSTACWTTSASNTERTSNLQRNRRWQRDFLKASSPNSLVHRWTGMNSRSYSYELTWASP